MSKNTSKCNSQNSKRGMRNKGQRKRNQREFDDMRDSKVKDSPTNDPAWYGRNPELLSMSASIPFSAAAGAPFNLGFTVQGSTKYQSKAITIPGLMTFTVIPCPHVEAEANDPLNIAANAMLSFVVHANSRNLSYNAPDLMIYNIAMGNIYAFINFCMRIYGTAQIYSTFNRNLPIMLTQAQGVNYANLMSHLADFRYGINVLINKAASLAAPADMPYFQRLAFMFAGLYSEGEAIKDQLYMYVPAGFMQYDETSSETGGSLKFMRWDDQVLHTVDEILTFGNNLLNAIITSEDLNVISGDILKAYGADGLLKLATMPEVYTVLPTTDLAVLEQMQNARWTDIQVNQSTISVTQKQSAKQGPVLTGGVEFTSTVPWLEAMSKNFLLTTILTDPTPGDVMERTRMMNFVYDLGDGGIAYYATEIVQFVRIWTMQNGVPVATTVSPLVTVNSAPTQAQMQNAINVHCMLENFKFHPVVFYTTVNGEVNTLLNIAVDVDNYAVFDAPTLERMNSAAVMSLFVSTQINLIR